MDRGRFLMRGSCSNAYVLVPGDPRVPFSLKRQGSFVQECRGNRCFSPFAANCARRSRSRRPLLACPAKQLDQSCAAAF